MATTQEHEIVCIECGKAFYASSKRRKKCDDCKEGRPSSNGHGDPDNDSSLSPSPSVSFVNPGNTGETHYIQARDNADLWNQGEVFVEVYKYYPDRMEWRLFAPRWLCLPSLFELKTTLPSGKYHFRIKKKGKREDETIAEIRDIEIDPSPLKKEAPGMAENNNNPVNPLFETLVGDLRSRLDRMEQRPAGEQYIIEHLREERDQAREEVKFLRSENAKLRQEMADLADQLNDKYLGHIADKDRIFATNQQQSEVGIASVVKQSLDTVNQMLNRYDNTVRTLQTEINKISLSSKDRELQARIDALEQKNAQANQQNTQIATLQARINELQNTVNVVQATPPGSIGSSMGDLVKTASEIKKVAAVFGMKDPSEIEVVEEKEETFMGQVSGAIKAFKDATNSTPDHPQPTNGTVAAPTVPPPAGSVGATGLGGWGANPMLMRPSPLQVSPQMAPAPTHVQPQPMQAQSAPIYQQQVVQPQYQQHQQPIFQFQQPQPMQTQYAQAPQYQYVQTQPAQPQPMQQVQTQYAQPQPAIIQQEPMQAQPQAQPAPIPLIPTLTIDQIMERIRPYMGHIDGFLKNGETPQTFATILQTVLKDDEKRTLKTSNRGQVVQGVAQMSTQDSLLRVRRGQQWLEDVLKIL